MILEEVYGIWDTPWWQTEISYGILIISISIIFIVGYLVKKYLFRARIVDSITHACNDISALEYVSKKTIEEQKKIYSILIQHFKAVAHTCFSLSSASMTDTEIVQNIKHHVPDEQFILIHEIFEHAQQVRFAHILISAEKISQDITYALFFINELNVKKEHTKKSHI